MSTYLYLVCEDHDPPLRSHDEVTQHASNPVQMERVRRWVRDREVLTQLRKRDELGYDDYFLNHAVTFLAQHPKCTISAVDEYGSTEYVL